MHAIILMVCTLISLKYFMNRIVTFITAAALVGVMDLSAQSKINPTGMMILDEYSSLKTTLANGETDIPVYSALVTLQPDCNAESVRKAGFKVVSDLGEVITVDLRLDQAETLAALPEVKYVSFGNTQNASMKFARPAGGVDEAQEGFTFNGTSHSYDGTGVVAGLFDTGMDANHCNFKNDNNTSRVQRLWWFRSTNGTASQYTDATISAFVTDNSGESHATHVAGIMAGSYKGNGQVAQVSNPTNGSGVAVGAGSIPYYGVATGASLAFSVGSLSDANIINGVTNIIDYAEQQGMPCVINLSLGSNTGPHDGSTSYDKALAALGKRAIICMSAGNEGEDPLFVTKEFSSATDDLKTIVSPDAMSNGNVATGIVDVWGRTNKVLSVSWAIYSASTRTLTTLATVSRVDASASVTTSNSTFNASFNGSISMRSEVNPLNNRYHVQCTLSGVSRKNTASYLALIVKAVDGETVYVYGGNSITFTSNSLVGYTTGSTDGTINDGACAENIISVGASTSARYFATLNRGVYAYNGSTAPGTIAPFSSYGYTFQGEPKPDLVGPGSAIVSSYSRYYVSANSLGNSGLCASATRAGVTNYWGPMQGTSMSCPFVSGVVALWLQANPNLKYEDIIDVIKNSSDFNSITMRPAVRWGAGQVNAVEGLKYILTNTGIGTVATDDPAKTVVLTPVMGGYEITVAGASEVNASLYSIAGIEAARVSTSGNSATLSTDGVQSGIYVLAVDTPAGRYTTKLAVK